MGSPTPEVIWMKNNGVRFPQFDSKDGYSILQLQAMNSRIAGIYTCIAHNSIGETLVTANVQFNSSLLEENEENSLLNESIKQNSAQINPSKALTILNCALKNNNNNLENRHVIWNNIDRESTEIDSTTHAMNNGSLVLSYFATV